MSSLIFQAQIEITQADMPSSGDTLRYSYITDTATINKLQVTANGNWENYNWKFNDLKPSQQRVRQFLAPSKTSYASTFTDPAVYGESVANVLPINLGSGFVVWDAYLFSKNTPAAFLNVGMAATINNIPVAVKYNNDDEQYQFPLQYKDRDSSTFDGSALVFSPLGAGAFFTRGYRITNVDGWGQVTTPYGTATCLRVVTTRYSNDSIKVPLVLSSAQKTAIRSYQWWTKGGKSPYFEIVGELTSGKFVASYACYRDSVRKIVSVGMTEYSPLSFEIKAYPNPAHGKINVQVPALKGTLQLDISDIRGTVQQHLEWEGNALMQNQHTLDISGLEPGIYLFSFRHATAVQSLRVLVE